MTVKVLAFTKETALSFRVFSAEPFRQVMSYCWYVPLGDYLISIGYKKDIVNMLDVNWNAIIGSMLLLIRYIVYLQFFVNSCCYIFYTHFQTTLTPRVYIKVPDLNLDYLVDSPFLTLVM